uniref:thiol oxidase n=1 Tax=viral metagenome TaxID=1070528 RepID=A0A6C0CKN7_9ZZZZ
MDTKIWGPAAWRFLHIVTFGYPERIDKKNAEHVDRMLATKRFFTDLGEVLPCIFCRKSWKEFLVRLPIDDFLESRQKLSFWLYTMHNFVNDKLRKSENETIKSVVEKIKSNTTEKVTKDEIAQIRKILCKKIKCTADKNPSFNDICTRYETYRVKCGNPNSILKSCRDQRNLKELLKKYNLE